MKALVVVFSMLVAFSALAQDRRSELDKAYEEARAAQLALKEAEARRDQAIEMELQPNQATSAGGTRPTEQYYGRQQLLERELEMARRRYDAALKRWNELK